MACADVIIHLVPIDYWNSEAFLVYHEYHDKRLCKPDLRHNDQEIFAQLRLEMFVAGLSFVTIFEKEANIRKAFGNFDPNIIVNFDAEKIGELMVDSEIIRNLKKIEAVINNVFVFLKLQSIFGTFNKYI